MPRKKPAQKKNPLANKKKRTQTHSRLKANKKKKPTQKTKKTARRATRAKTQQQTSGIERRIQPRVPLQIKINYFEDPGVFLYDYSRNLGRGGIFIQSQDPLPPGTEINLTFTLPDQREPIAVKGKVTWTLKPQGRKVGDGIPGMGVAFENPEGEYKDALDRFFREIDYDNLNF